VITEAHRKRRAYFVLGEFTDPPDSSSDEGDAAWRSFGNEAEVVAWTECGSLQCERRSMPEGFCDPDQLVGWAHIGVQDQTPSGQRNGTQILYRARLHNPSIRYAASVCLS